MALSQQEQQIVQFGKANGKTPDQVIQAISNYRKQQQSLALDAAGAPQKTAPTPDEQQGPGFGERVVGDVANRFKEATKLSEESTGKDVSFGQGLQKQFQAGGQIAGIIGDIFTEGIKSIDQSKLGQEMKAKHEAQVAKGEQLGVSEASKEEFYKNIGSKFSEWAQAHPEAAKNLEATLNFAGAIPVGGVASELRGAVPEIKTATAELVSKGKNIIDNVTEIASVNKKAAKQALENSKIVQSITPTSESIMNRVARLNPTDARKFEELAGKTHGKYLEETGNFGTPDKIIKNEAQKFVQSMNDVDNALEKLPGTYQPKEASEVINVLEARLKKVKSPEALRITELKNKLNTEGLNMKELNELKRSFERNVKLAYNKAINPDATALATNLDNNLRNWQVKQADILGFENISEMNKQTQLSRFISNKLGSQIIGKNGLNGVSLTDWIMLSGGDPTSVAGFLTKKFFSDPGIQAKIAKFLSKAEPKGAVKPIIGETKLTRIEAPKTKYSGVKVEAPINLPEKTVTTLDKLERKKMGIARSIDTRIPKKPLGLPSPSGKASVIELPGVGTFKKSEMTKSGIIEVIKAKIKNPYDRRKLIKIIKES